jgi:hypothetical protein
MIPQLWNLLRTQIWLLQNKKLRNDTNSCLMTPKYLMMYLVVRFFAKHEAHVDSQKKKAQCLFISSFPPLA